MVLGAICAMTSEQPDFEIVRLVLGVARLGEQDLRGWWQGHALDRTGRYVLSSMFKRTWRAAALQIDVAAAARIHDELLGRATALHLFSDGLPFRRWAVGWLAERKASEDEHALLRSLEAWNKDSAVAALREWCGAMHPRDGESLGNGILLGRVEASRLGDPRMQLEVAQALCLSYLDQAGAIRPPYFDLSR